jgi:glycerol-3-phosphate acyltransferase PlsX
MIRIAVDAMGGDHAPREIVHGSILAAQEYGIAIQLVGPPDVVNAELKRHDTTGLKITVVPASEVVAMDEKPSRAILKKKDSSIVVTTKLVSDGLADGMVACGSTGAAAVAAQIGLGRINHVDRSAIGAFMPTTGDFNCVLVDGGANVDCNALQLEQFGMMGSILYKGVFGVQNPRVGLLNIGTEESKGNELVQEAYKLLKANRYKLNFIGFCEGRDFPMGKVDVVVTDGFSGNLCLKTAEGIANMVLHMLRQELLRSTRVKIGSMICKPAFQGVKKRIDHNEFGGALLLGVKGVCVIAHGGSKHTAVKNAIRVAKDMAAAKIVDKIEAALAAAAKEKEGTTKDNNGASSESSSPSSSSDVATPKTGRTK